MLLSLRMPVLAVRSSISYYKSHSHYQINEFSLQIHLIIARSWNTHYWSCCRYQSSNSHYRSMFSLPDLRVLTINPCSHYQIFEFSLPLAVLTTRSSNSHYRMLFWLPDLRILATERYSHYQIFEFSLPGAVLTTRSSNFHYRALFSLPDMLLSIYQ